MEILKKGKEFGPVLFDCRLCGCSFRCLADEYDKDYVCNQFSMPFWIEYKALCPNCGNFVRVVSKV